MTTTEESIERVFEFLVKIRAPIFGLYDAAVHPMVLALLNQSNRKYQSLYEGPAGEALADVAPYLIEFSKTDPMIRTFVEQGWGQSWGLFLTSNQPFADIRKNFRKFLMVETESNQELYFRFYDPRVLRAFLPTCTAEQASQFFGPVDCFFVESTNLQELLMFPATRNGAPKVLKLADLTEASYPQREFPS